MIKELSAYLPYGLKVVFTSTQGKGHIDTMAQLDAVHGILTIPSGTKRCLSHIKPLLRPLSDLTKEIEHNGEKFVPFSRLCDAGWVELIDTSESDIINNPLGQPYYFIQCLLEMHFDVFNLLGQNKAIAK